MDKHLDLITHFAPKHYLDKFYRNT